MKLCLFFRVPLDSGQIVKLFCMILIYKNVHLGLLCSTAVYNKKTTLNWAFCHFSLNTLAPGASLVESFCNQDYILVSLSYHPTTCIYSVFSMMICTTSDPNELISSQLRPTLPFHGDHK